MKYFIYRNFTVEPLFSNLDARFSGYNDIFEYDSEADTYVWFYNIPLNPDLTQQIDEIEHYSSKIDFLLNKIPSSKNFLIFTLVDIFSSRWQNSDFALYNIIFEFNNKIFSLSKTRLNIKIIEFEDFTKNFANGNLINWKYYYTSLTYISPALSEKFQGWFIKKINAIISKRKKCIVLDLDNTIWGGVLGEEGVAGIQLGNTYPGNCYSDLQRYMVQASEHGIILAVCSKNNESDAIEVFEKNPNMILKLNHIVAYRINWENKPTNIKDLANEINIGTDSMVFIDDNPVERELVKSALPGIVAPEFPKEPYNINIFIKTVLEDYFQIYSLTKEDLDKTSQYKENFQRDNFKGEFTSVDDFLKNLGIEITISKADKFNISRIAQMTQKTNQFNLTTYRYTENEIRGFIENGDMVFCASVKDKFGDNGITMMAIVTFDSSHRISAINSYLLSCRILGRGIENVFLNFILNQIYLRGYRKVEAVYLPTPKNGQVGDFYEKNGFYVTDKEDGMVKYAIEMDKEIEIESYYKIIYSES
jgi:FkbH-like protein